ncbi:MAG: Uma2 family endonuclease [Burkholderiales bacterium]|nr:Uma2 family endonuclease [Phycisphaerae bacterium]
MTAELIPSRKFTVEEYLDYEQTSELKHDFFNGELLDMSGGSMNHSGITSNLIIEFGMRVKGTPCRVFESNLRVRVQKGTLYSYPDLMIVCGEPQHDPADKHKTTIINPRVIFEVLSPSTELWDRSEKFKRYRNLDSLEEYVLVSQNIPSVDSFWKDADGNWSLRGTDGLETSLALRSMAIEVPMSDVYRGVEFPPQAA